MNHTSRDSILKALDDDLVRLALRRASVDAVLEASCHALVAAGVPIDEARIGIRTLHPTIDAFGATWAAGAIVDHNMFAHTESDDEQWRRSPLYHLISSRGRLLRRRLTGAKVIRDFSVLDDLRADGFADYVVILVPFGEDRGRGLEGGMVLRWLTRHPDGFRDDDVALLDRLADRLGAAVLPGQERVIARNLLDAYIGPRSGARVLDGAIQRGDTVTIDAVILFTDLAGFTKASDTVPADRMVDMLNRHMDAMVPPVIEHGGEILAFLGDGFLAVFETGDDPSGACRTALDAAIAIRDGTTALAGPLMSDGLPSLLADTVLHLGAVRYGNMGAAGRQAFTVIGPAVNEASRIEALCSSSGERILASGVFAERAQDDRLEPLGARRLRGVSEPVIVHRVVAPREKRTAAGDG
ncbi:MAG: adenylate/guanylate cyclase domain-containing protein [Alphaproteobacteria bacterium]|nr:adenylate/guanylate cyclase domain-containing protein [Alphaproteobacteria bacterium]